MQKLVQSCLPYIPKGSGVVTLTFIITRSRTIASYGEPTVSADPAQSRICIHKACRPPSRRVSLTPWDKGYVPPSEDEEEKDDIDDKVVVNNKMISVWKDDRQPALQHWRRFMNQQLRQIAQSLPSFSKLRSFSFEATCEYDADNGPRWDYLDAVTVFHVIQKLPSGLDTLNLDLCGSELLDEARNGIHICPLLAQRLGDFRCVRLRMRSMCPEIFEQCRCTGRLEQLIIKLNLPTYSDFNSDHGSLDTKLCREDYRELPTEDIVMPMTLAGVACGTKLASEMFRIGLRDPRESRDPRAPRDPRALRGLRALRGPRASRGLRASRGPRASSAELVVLDCLRNELLYRPFGDDCVQDHGQRWYFDEESPYLQGGTGFSWM